MSLRESFQCYWNVLFTPFWYGVIGLLCCFCPLFMAISCIVDVTTDTFGPDVYMVNASVDLMCGLVGPLAISVVGNMSQPSKFGRKKMLVFISAVKTVPLIATALTGSGYGWIMGSIFMCVFAAREPGGLEPILQAWITDWASEREKMSILGVQSGILSACFVTFSLLAGVLLRRGIVTSMQLMQGAAVFSCLGPLYFAFVFPTKIHRERMPDGVPVPHLPRMRSGQSLANMNSVTILIKSMWQTSVRAFRYLAYKHHLLLGVAVILFGVQGATMEVQLSYMKRQFAVTDSQLSFMLTFSGLAGTVGQLLILPIFQAFMSAYSALAVCVFAVFTQMVVFTQASTPLAFYVGMALGSASYISMPLIMSIIAKCQMDGSLTTSEERNQGSIIGGFVGIRAMVNAVGPLLIALCLSNWPLFPPPFNFPSVGFALMSCLMLVATFLACLLVFRKNQHGDAPVVSHAAPVSSGSSSNVDATHTHSGPSGSSSDPLPVPGLGETPYEQLNGEEHNHTREKEAAGGDDSPGVGMVRSESDQTDPLNHTDHPCPSRGYLPPSPRFLWQKGHELPLLHQGKDGGSAGGGGLTPSTAAGTPLSLERVDSDAASCVEEGRRTHRRMSSI
ncbi:unnamed protein product [Vitrella brassicaformis CCMP3155]|uniref:Major facilitator superfamily (MFS) profile domain-containing protein n=2 Tax=Vitrella brassicaformis TaxID=1169539 RepID=A0A0G4FNM9_VITBC|nr:unnamed protein product [Vitrella brassicaformis CCMP3155]|mmetsp:Transcript_18807/g.45288  ORF Transcript_18807/g.45288 Transcript_18807/m.45288 type:complete len:618 (+) Transcript_18807:295-2148(+)|eukprot:CEM15826.1 unnamed protein product [Vitrella brassicaformis CCMP3155]